MQPRRLILKGFRGIRDGLGLDVLDLELDRLVGDARLVAIAGANGRGKSTVMDNLHPYLTMPSRAGQAGPGGFSYHDHIVGHEGEKDLVWTLAGRWYRSQVVICANGRRRTEAYLLVRDDACAWRPARVDDGTVSDGKVETYTRCVEALCGPAQTFFTSVYAAQGKRQLSAYRNAEIKALLADLLGQERILAMGQRAGQVVRLLKAALARQRAEQAALEEQEGRAAAQLSRLAGASGRVREAAAARCVAQAALDEARAGLAAWQMRREQDRELRQHREDLERQRAHRVAADAQAMLELDRLDEAVVQRGARWRQRAAERLARQAEQRQRLLDRIGQQQQLLQHRPAVARAARRLPWAERVADRRGAQLAAARAAAEEGARRRARVVALEHRSATLNQELSHAQSLVQGSTRRCKLGREVPCAGTSLHGRCKLLSDARDAQMEVVEGTQMLERLEVQRRDLAGELATARQTVDALAGADMEVARAQARDAKAQARRTRLALLAARGAAMRQAEQVLSDLEAELARLDRRGELSPSVEDPEGEELARIDVERRRLADQRATWREQSAHALQRLDEALQALPAGVDLGQVQAAEQAVVEADAEVRAAEQHHLAAVRDHEALAWATAQAAERASRQQALAFQMERTQDALADWTLFTRCMGPDGLIALTIDDAGPALSALVNDLLLACYGPRFTVAIDTLCETARGDQREGFDIRVHDAESGQDRSVTAMSGGERVWVNECLVRAVALYQAQQTGRRHETLFSDETDGALDPERKRMFLAMKRRVLALGGYAREYFVSQTPELTAAADAVVDLDGFLG